MGDFLKLIGKNVMVYAPYVLERKTWNGSGNIISCVFLFLDKDTALYQDQIWRYGNVENDAVFRFYFDASSRGNISFFVDQRAEEEERGNYVRLADHGDSFKVLVDRR